MKKFISILVLLSAFAFAANAATITYYVDTTGSDQNDGLTMATPFDSITTAITAATAAYTNDNADNEFVIEVGAGTFTEANFVINNVTLTINGQGANATILQGGESLSTTATRVFSACSNVSIILNDLAIKNYGASVGTGASSALMDLEIAGRNMEVNRVAFSNITGSFAALARNKNNNVLVFNECSFTDITVTNAASIITVVGLSTTEINNCFFNNCVKEVTSGTPATSGTILQSNVTNGSSASNIVKLVNNTFVNCGLVNSGGSLSKRQGLIFVKSKATFTNNIICGSKKADATDYRDLIAYNGGYVTENCANNIFGTIAEVNFPEEGSFISDTLKLSSPEVDFKMEDGALVIDTTATGIVYATAMGDSVVGQASATTQTTKDIAGEMRLVPGCIGAFEYVKGNNEATALETVNTSVFTVYPNPAQDVLYIKGDVARVAIYSIAGAQVVSTDYTASGINVSTLNRGIYFVKCQDLQGKTLDTQKVSIK